MPRHPLPSRTGGAYSAPEADAVVDLEALKTRYRDAQRRHAKACANSLAPMPVSPGEEPESKEPDVFDELAGATEELNAAGKALLRGLYEAQGLTPPPAHP
jgi:hypothetical protein